MPHQVFLVDDDIAFRDSVRVLLEAAGHSVRDFASAKRFLADWEPKEGCLIADIRMPEMDGLELQEELIRRGIRLGVIFITGHADVPLAVRAMKLGAVDFIEKPFEEQTLLNSIKRGLMVGHRIKAKVSENQAARDMIAALTPREREILQEIVKGHPNKIVAFDLGISIRTVENHRANLMEKLDARNLSDLVRISLASATDSDQPNI